MEYLRNLSSQEFVSKYGAPGIDEIAKETRRFLDPNTLGYSPKEVAEITNFRSTKIVELGLCLTSAQVATEAMNHVYACKGYLYRFFTQFLKHFLTATVVPVGFDLVYCTAATQQSYDHILNSLKKDPSHNKPITEIFHSCLSQDGAYIIYLHFSRGAGHIGGHHALNLIKKGKQITFFCPLHGIAEFSGPACQEEFLKWIKLESESGSLDYFSPRVSYYAEVARIPLPIEKGALVAVAALPALPSQGFCGTCGKPAGLKCSRCGIFSYCNGTCQAAHWPTHKLVCKKKS